MTENLEHSWVKEIFTQDELKQYAEFENKMKSEQKKTEFKKNWHQLLDELKNNLKNDPCSEIGIQLGKKYMEWLNGVYGKKYAHLRTKKWEKGFGEGKGLDDVGLTPELMIWIEKAIDAYFRNRIYGLLNNVSTIPSFTALKLWNEILDDMYGEEEARKITICEAALKDEKVNQEAKIWLRNLLKSQ